MQFKKFVLTASYWCAFSWLAVAQTTAPDNWFNLDQSKDKVMGVSSEKAYQELLKDKKPKKKVIVAVIDSGVEADHDDLKDVMWKNAKEVAGNAVDDDKNGYVDDIYGWNFIGGKDGKNVDADNLEITRLYSTLKSKTKRNKKEEKEFKSIKNDFESRQQKSQSEQQVYMMVMGAIKTAKTVAGKDDVSAADLDKLDESKPEQQAAKMVMKELLKDGKTLKDMQKDLDEWSHYVESQKYQYDTEFNTRTIVGDDYKNVQERNYGNNDVEGPDAGHGTHVAGIIAANRTNDKGMKGVADYVEIMAVRVVPNGDERDKDVANGIYYAVDNGATIINMSFGKGYSPNKDIVDKAVQYAEKKGVLLVHAAGNEAKNIDENNNFPSKFFGVGKRKKQAKNWLEVGALSWKGGADAPAEFSNYGKKTVDLFAPGVDIYSTIPDNGYQPNSGTSMAAPVAAGVAALVWSYYPELTVFQLREILLKSAEPMNTAVKQPGSQTPNVNFQDLSITGGVINAYKALELAEKMVKK